MNSAQEVVAKLIARIENLERRPLPGPVEVPKPVDMIPVHRRLAALEARPVPLPPVIQLPPPKPASPPARWPVVIFATVWPLIVAAAYYWGL